MSPSIQSRQPDLQALSGACRILAAGHTLWLMPECAIYWPSERMLFVADVHLGKAASFRQQGQPVPVGTTSETLGRLTRAIARSGADHLVVLGDFLHSAHVQHARGTLQALAAWRHRHADLSITLIRGNHDEHAGDPASGFKIAIADEPWQIGPFSCRHMPEPRHGSETLPGEHPTDPSNQASFWLAGHLHPVLNLKSRTGERFRLKAFIVSDQGCLLPAFGAFTGGHPHEPVQGEQCFGVIDGYDEPDGVGRVIPVPAHAVYTKPAPRQRDVRSLTRSLKTARAPSGSDELP